MAGVPRYPKDIRTEWMQLKQEVKNAFTTGNSRQAATKIASAIVSVSTALIMQAGSYILFYHPNGNPGLRLGRHFSGSEEYDGMFIKRPDGETAIWIADRVSDGFAFTSLYDREGNSIFSDDYISGKGLGRPYISQTFVDTTDLAIATPASRQTTSTTDVAVVSSYPLMQHPRWRIVFYVNNGGGGTNNVKVTNVGNGAVLYSGTHGNGWASADFEIDSASYVFGSHIQLDVSIRRASGAGLVGITVLHLYGIES